MISNKYSTLITSAINTSNQIRQTKDGWNFVTKGKHYSLHNRSYSNCEVKLLKIEGVISIPQDKIQAFYFENFQGQKKNREMVDDLFSIEQIDKDTKINVFRIKSKFVVSARENLGVAHRRQVSPNEFMIVISNLDDHPLLPKQKDIIRSEIKVYSIFLTKLDSNQTKVEFYIQNDPKGSIPVFIVNNMVEQLLKDLEKDVESLLSQK